MIILKCHSSRWKRYVQYYAPYKEFLSLEQVYHNKPRGIVVEVYNKLQSYFNNEVVAEKHGIIQRSNSAIVYGAIFKTIYSDRTLLVVHTGSASYLVPRDSFQEMELVDGLNKLKMGCEE